VETSTPTGKLVADVMVSGAEWERQITGEHTSVAMHVAKRQGRDMGRVSVIPQGASDRLLPPSNHADPRRGRCAAQRRRIPTATRAPWSASTVERVKKRINVIEDNEAASAACRCRPGRN
jgi:DNA invertase Pin-like site-specific DNA recombinase